MRPAPLSQLVPRVAVESRRRRQARCPPAADTTTPADAVRHNDRSAWCRRGSAHFPTSTRNTRSRQIGTITVDFTLAKEQQSLRAMAHDVAALEIRPVAWEYDRDGT
jgi:hypothetical protein